MRQNDGDHPHTNMWAQLQTFIEILFLYEEFQVVWEGSASTASFHSGDWY